MHATIAHAKTRLAPGTIETGGDDMRAQIAARAPGLHQINRVAHAAT
jgi:hypothetical protein